MAGHIIGSFKIGEQQYSLCDCVRLHSIIFLSAGYCDTPSKNNCTANSLCQDDVNNGFKCSCLANYQEQNNVCTRKYKLYLDLGLFFFVLRFFYFFFITGNNFFTGLLLSCIVRLLFLCLSLCVNCQMYQGLIDKIV